MARFKWTDVDDAPSASTVAWTASTREGSDPYLIWMDLTTAPPKAAARQSREARMGVLVELQSLDAALAFFELMNAQAEPDDADFVLSAIAFANMRFVSGVVTMRGLCMLIDPANRHLVRRFTLQESRSDSTLGLLRQAGKFSRAVKRAAKAGQLPGPEAAAGPTDSPKAPAASGPATSAFLGIIDDGLPFLRVREDISVRKLTASVWDQGWQPPDRVGDPNAKPTVATSHDKYWADPRMPKPIHIGLPSPIPGSPGRSISTILFVPDGFLYGRATKPPEVAPGTEEDEYRASDYATPAVRHTHGARVLGLMAPWTAAETAPPVWPNTVTGLAMVQLPSRAVDDTAAGALARQLIDGVRYVLWKEDHDRGSQGTPRPVVVNISYGMHAGPHDGTSMFESALEEMLDRCDNLHVVLPMGNSHRAGCHARHRLEPQGDAGDTCTMHIDVQADNPRDTFVEIWLEPGDDVDLTLYPPGSAMGHRIEPGQARIATLETPAVAGHSAAISFAALYPRSVAQSTRRTMILLAIAPTRRVLYGDDTTRPPRGLGEQPRQPLQGLAGIWRIEAKNRGQSAMAFDCWIERDDVRPGQWLAPRQARFPDSCVLPTYESDPLDTLNGIATSTHERVYAVGAMRADAVLSDYSGAAASADPANPSLQPWAVVPADWSCAVAGVRTTGFLQGSTVRINGTSAAAAVFTRSLVDALCGEPPPLPPVPTEHLPEKNCAPERWPAAAPQARGESRRALMPFGVDQVAELLARSGQTQVPRH